MSNLKDIVNVSIDIAAPVIDSTSFDHLLIFGPAPAVTPSTAPPDVGVYSSLEEVTDAGWVTTGEDADPVGIAARVAFSQSPQPPKIYIAVQKLTTPDEGDPVPETPVATIARAIPVSGWYIACPAGIPEEDYEDCAAYVETQTKLFAFPVFDDLEAVGNVYYRSLGIFAKETWEQPLEEVPEANRYIHVAFSAKCLYYTSGSETWAFKALSSIYPSELNSTRLKELDEANVSFYATYSSKNITQGAKVKAGEWIDVIRFRDWQQNDMQVRIFNLLVVNPKIPYTNAGISLVESQMIASLEAGVKAGGIALDEYDESGETVPGYLVSVPNASSLTASQRASRILTDCKFAARLAGAIHVIEVKGSLAYSN